ncbi:hypothetical protein JYU34_013035 [Plutella xylostella]|uniref:Poly(A)-specific ribonuclease RNA-binding domain-containing protein n=1 Tax=Plutella xylostella TaxID=51655 RepID=A0ABQ7QCS8_PLUXY|nr:hypothetical protein JYU34_013035 [Plutella xylostella]
MEVTRKNFKEVLPLVASSIKEADFLVIDTEFTGLINGRDVSIFDSPQEYYLRLLNGATEFLLIQFGLCTFYWDEETKQYKNEAYNFYLFPRGRPGPEKLFLCQSSSLDFLASQGFDFNKVIKDGISYMTEPTESRLRDNLTERQKLYSNDNNIIPIPEENKQHIEDICKRVREFLDERKSDVLEIDRCNAFVRRLLFQELAARFKNECFVETKVLENKNRVLKVTRITADNDGKDRDTLKKEKEWEELDEAVGFSKVARMISQSEKLVIGHNMLLDVLHTLNHFFQPLPADYQAFKEFTTCMFPRLLDTKYMSSLPPFKDKVNSSVLQHLFATLGEEPFHMPTADSTQGRGYTQADDKNHEAGYDAYVTGLCFLSMYSHLTSMRGEPTNRVAAESAILKPFVNKLFLAKTAHQDSPYINLAGKDPTPTRDHVFYMTFPKEWQRNDINQLFSPFGPISVQFLDETSGLVALQRREQARDVTRVLGKSKHVTLVPYVKYKHALAKTQSQNDKQWRKPEEPSCTISSPVSASWTKPKPDNSQQFIPQKIDRAAFEAEQSKEVAKLPEKVEVLPPQDVTSEGRRRSQSMTSSSPSPVRGARKRTSSGVFQVDEAEPPPKKIEISTAPEVSRKTEATNGKRKATEKAEGVKEKAKVKAVPKKVIERFDSASEAKVVSAFKESDSWD